MFIVPMDTPGITIKSSTTMYDGSFANIRNNPDQQEVRFAPVAARFFRFTALREIWRNGWTSAAEISVIPADPD